MLKIPTRPGLINLFHSVFIDLQLLCVIFVKCCFHLIINANVKNLLLSTINITAELSSHDELFGIYLTTISYSNIVHLL